MILLAFWRSFQPLPWQINKTFIMQFYFLSYKFKIPYIPNYLIIYFVPLPLPSIAITPFSPISFSKCYSTLHNIFFPFQFLKRPRFSSNDIICLESVGWVICNCSAAFALLECSQEVINGMVNSTYIFDTLPGSSL